MDRRTNRNRLAEIAHYVIARCEPSDLGATKLNKALWFIDCAAYRRWGESLTGLTHYRKLQHGPVPEGMDDALNGLKLDGKVKERPRNAFDQWRREFVALEEPELEGRLTADEVDLIQRFLTWIRPMSAQEVSEKSHDALWDETSNGAQMSVAAGSIRPALVSADSIDWANDELRRLGLIQ